MALDVWTASGRRKRLLVLGVASIVFCVCCGLLSHFARHPFNGIDVDRLADDLHSSLPVGSTRQAAEEWLARHGIEHVEDSDDAGVVGKISNSTLFERADIEILLYYGPGGLEHSTVERRVSLQR